MELDVQIKKGLVEEFKKVVESKRGEGADLSVYFLQDLVVNDDGSFEFEDYYGVHYGDKEFVKFIAPFVEWGCIEFVGEDGERWGYQFCGDGRVRDVVYERVVDGFFIE